MRKKSHAVKNKKTKNKQEVSKLVKKPTNNKLLTTKSTKKDNAVDDVNTPVKTKPKMYFTKDTEIAIIEYNKETDNTIRNRIYEDKIKYAFEKLAENIFNTFKFSYFDISPLDVQKETVSHLVSNMHKFEEGKGKAFGYFSVIAKNYLIFHNNNNYKRYNQQVNISETPCESSVCLQTSDSYHKDVELDEFMNMMIKYWETNITKVFTKERDLSIANAVVELFRNYRRIDCFNKKALYFYIREMSDCRTQQITKVINKFKSHQDNITRLYRDTGTFSEKMI
jgi:hypothetical protein